VTLYCVQSLEVSIGGKTLVEDVSFEIAGGQCLALVGESGSGKSLTCLTPFGLSPGISSGSAQLHGTELFGMSERDLRSYRARDIGFIFQQPLTSLTPHLSIGAQLAEAACQSGAPKPSRRELAA
jgi:ABC-type glutathione transport system ATPase component